MEKKVVKRGIDLSKWNEVYEYDKLVKNIDFAMIRAGYGRGNEDIYAYRHYTGLEEYNIPIGLYWFSYASNEKEARNEAKYLLKFAYGKCIEYPLCFDFEKESMLKKNLSAKQVNAIARAFLEEIEKAGYYAIIYTNKDFADTIWSDELLHRYGVWYARYGEKYIENPGRECQILQYSSTGEMEGIHGAVDLNVSYIDFKTLIKSKGLNSFFSDKEVNGGLNTDKNCCSCGCSCGKK